MYRLTTLLVVLVVAFSGCSSGKLSADKSINQKISWYISENETLSLDNIAQPWDNVLIDSVYDAESAFEKLNIDCSDMDPLPQNDELVVVFVSDNKIKAYAVIGSDETETVEYLEDYLYQNKERIYPFGTEFKK